MGGRRDAPARMALILIAAVACADCRAAETTGSDPTGAEVQDASALRDALRTFGEDGGYLLTFPRRITPRGAWMTVGVLAGTTLLMGRDDEIRNHVLMHESRTSEDLAGVFEPLGTYLVAGAGLGTTYLAGRAAHRERLATTAAVAFEAWTWTAVITAASKGLFGRQPPAAGFDEDDFFDGGTIFPSGHTSRSFAIAAVFADRYGPPAAWIGYPVAALVGLSTIEQDTHWASDVLAGAALGLAIGKGIAARHRLRETQRPAEQGTGAGGGAAARAQGGARWTWEPARGGITLMVRF